MRVLITGGAGFVGSHVAEYYAKNGDDVVIFDNFSRATLLGHMINVKYNDPLNLGTGEEIKIKDLAKLILKLTGYENARVVFDKSKPVGQLKQRVDVTKAREKIGFVAEIRLEDGLRETIEWYKKTRGIG